MIENSQPRTPQPYAFWQILILIGMSLTIGKMMLDMDEFHKETRDAWTGVQPILHFARDVHADISKSTLCVTHDKVFQIHRVRGTAAKYYGGSGTLIREDETGSTRYELKSGAIHLGMDHGMIISHVFWGGRQFVFGAPPGWAVTIDELTAR